MTPSAGLDGLAEITELIRRRLQQELYSAAAAQFSVPSSWSGAVSSFSSPFGGMERKGFWFNVNAELIIYGATEPNAQVTIGGRVIKLRPDGTFSYRFALPDGQFGLPAMAIRPTGPTSATPTFGSAAAPNTGARSGSIRKIPSSAAAGRAVDDCSQSV